MPNLTTSIPFRAVIRIVACALLTLSPGFAQSVRSQTPSVDSAAVRRFQQDLPKFTRKEYGAVLVDSQVQRMKANQLFTRRRTELFSDLGISDSQRDQIAAPWEMLAFAIKQQTAGGAAWSGFQVVSTPASASWNDAKLGPFYKNRIIGDSLPVWGPTYAASARQISIGYLAFLDNIAIPLPDPEMRKKADKARDKYEKAVQAEEAKEIEVDQSWAAFDRAQSVLPPANRKTFDQWYQQFGGNLMIGAKQDVRLAAQELDHYLAAAYQGYAFAATLAQDYDNDANQVTVIDDNGKVEQLHTYSISPDLDAFISVSKGLASSAPPRLDMSFSKSSGRTHTENTSWSASASWFGAFCVGANGSTATLDTSNDQFGMEISAKNYQVFTVQPGPWFNATAVQALQNGPWIANGPVATGQTILWGQNGVFNLLPGQIVVAYRPKVKLTLSHSDYQSVKTAISGGGGFSIGPFGFGASYHRDTSDIHFDDQNSTITAEDTSDVPQIVAVVSFVLPNFN